MKLRSTPQSEDALMIMSLIVSSPKIENSYPNSYPPLHMARTWMDMHRLRRLHDSQYIMKNPFTNENSNLSNIFHNNIHRKKVESLKVRSTEEFLCQFAWLPCRFFRGRRQGRQPLNKERGEHICPQWCACDAICLATWLPTVPPRALATLLARSVLQTAPTTCRTLSGWPSTWSPMPIIMTLMPAFKMVVRRRFWLDLSMCCDTLSG